MIQESAPNASKTAASVPVDADWDGMSDEEKLAVFKDWRAASDMRSEAWLRQARESYRYVESDQVPEALRGRMNVVEGRMLWLSIVGLRYLIHGKVGTMMAEDPEPHFEGVEYGDSSSAAIASEIVGFTFESETTRFHSTARRAVWDQHVCGMGFMKEYKEEDVEIDLGDGNIVFGDVAATWVDPELVRLDPTSRPGNRASINYLIELEPVLLRDLRAKWGDRVKDVKGRTATEDIRETFLKDYDKNRAGATSRHEEFGGSGGDESQGCLDFNKIAILEHFWYIQRKRVAKVFSRQDGGTYAGTDITPEEIPAGEGENYRTVYQTKRIVRYACMVEDIILEDGPTKFDDIPYPIFFGEQIHGYHLCVGDIYHLVHVVNLLNGLATNMVDNAVRTSNSGRYWEKSALSATEKKRLADEGHLPGFNFEVEDGYIDRVKRDEPGSISESVYRIWTDVQARVYDQLSGQPQVQRGGMPYDTSGRGIIALGQRADTGLSNWQKNIEEALTLALRLRWRNIQVNYTFDRVLRISGKVSDSVTYNALKIQKQEDGRVQVLNNEGGDVFIHDLSTAKFDMKVTIRRGMPLSPEEKRQQAIFLFEAHLVPERWFVGPDGLNLKDGEELLEEAKKERAGYELQQQVQKAIEVRPELLKLIQNPELLDSILDAATPALTGIQVVDGQAQVPEAMMAQYQGGGGNGTPVR